MAKISYRTQNQRLQIKLHCLGICSHSIFLEAVDFFILRPKFKKCRSRIVAACSVIVVILLCA